MKLAKYERKQAKRSGYATVEKFRDQFDVTQCDCGADDCPGWRARYMFRAERRRKGLLA